MKYNPTNPIELSPSSEAARKPLPSNAPNSKLNQTSQSSSATYGFSQTLDLSLIKEKKTKRSFIPILKRHSTNLGYVAQTLAHNPEAISKAELKRWLKKQAFDISQLELYVRSIKQPDWSSAIGVFEGSGGHCKSSLIDCIPSSILAELASKRVDTLDQHEEVLVAVGHRIASESEIVITSQLLNGVLQASVSFGNLVAASELVDYAIRFSTEIARVEVEKQLRQSISTHHQLRFDSSTNYCKSTSDSALAIRPLISCIAGLMNQRAACSRTPIFRFLRQLLQAAINLCGGLDSVFSRISGSNIHLLCRAMITSMMSPDGYSLKAGQIDLILKQNLTSSTLRLALIAMINVGDRDLANKIERILLKKRENEVLMNCSKLKLDLAFNQVRRCKSRAYSHSEKLHQNIFSRIDSIESKGDRNLVEPYTLYMSTLYRHHLPKIALKVWERVIQKKILPDAAAIQVAMAVYIDLYRPGEAVKLFNQFCSPQSSSHAEDLPSIGISKSPNLQVIATYARALDLSGHHHEIYELWKKLESDWSIRPDERIFASLVSSARKLTFVNQGKITNSMLHLDRHKLASEASLGYDYWDGKPAGELVIQMFWSVLYQNWPTLAIKVQSPLRSMYGWAKPSAHDRLWSQLQGLSPPQESKIAQFFKLSFNSNSKAAATTIIPSLSSKTKWYSIIPTRHTFRDVIEILGLIDHSHLVPLDLIIRSYYWIYKSNCPPLLDRITSLDRFVEDWIEKQTLPDKKVEIPTQEILEKYHVERFRWSRGFFNQLFR
ncbi:hypothetical protein BY996DRAFT_6431570 [Phakopsora pachyrhizi]|nr:hypothetical protein BY996DRAFT_6431570 [Phakopsora pachyrhizi]